jgi:hypothetical protein
MRHPIARRLWVVLIGLLLGVIAVGGLSDAVNNFGAAETGLQRAFVPVQVAYGIASVFALASLTLSWRRSPIVFAVWGLIVTAAATLAPVAWGGAGLGPALAGGAVTAVVCALIVWGQARFVRSPTAPDSRDEPPAPA